MKQQQITIGNKTILVVDLPGDAIEVHVSTNCLGFKSETHVADKDTNGFFHACVELGFARKWQLLGFVSEDVAVKVVKDNDGKGFIGATKEGDMRFIYTTALFTLRSILQSNGIITVNPYGENEPICDEKCYCKRKCDKEQWQTAESQLWVNPVLLKKNDDE